MLYLIVFLFSWPLLAMISLFRPIHPGRILVIHTGKIGDYVNASVMWGDGQPVELLIDQVNRPLALRDGRVVHIETIQEARQGGIMGRLRFAWRLYWRGYAQILVSTPNALNLFFALQAHPRSVVTLQPYRTGLTARLLMACCQRRLPHAYQQRTIDSYWRLRDPSGSSPPPMRVIPSVDPARILPELLQAPQPRIGLAIVPGNRSKTIPPDEWAWLVQTLQPMAGSLFFFGQLKDHPYETAIREQLPSHGLPIHSLLGKTGIADLPDNLAQMDLVAGADSGPLYLASTFGVPLLLYAGPCYLPEQSPWQSERYEIPPGAPVSQHSYIFDTLHGADSQALFRTDDAQRKMITTWLENQCHKRVESSAG